MTISIEYGQAERSIVTPDLRLRFNRLGDRWTHAIDVGPGPWKVAAESVEWESPNLSPPAFGPTIQEIQFRERADDVVALAIGQAGPHHFSASFRVHRREWECDHPTMPWILQKRCQSFVDIDIADRCRSLASVFEARYRVGARVPMWLLNEGVEGWNPEACSGLGWEVIVPQNYDFCLEGAQGPSLPPSRLTVRKTPPDLGWDVAIAPVQLSPGGTNRLAYTWSHHRVKVFDRTTDTVTDWSWS